MIKKIWFVPKPIDFLALKIMKQKQQIEWIIYVYNVIVQSYETTVSCDIVTANAYLMRTSMYFHDNTVFKEMQCFIYEY